MSTLSFIIIISLMSAGMIFTLLSVLHFEPIAKAGKVNKFCWKYHVATSQSIDEIAVGNERIDVSGLKWLYVYGNSMHKYGIKSNQQVLVKPYTENEKSNISTYPVLVLTISKQIFDSDYKLRKFVGYVSNIEQSEEFWASIYDKYATRIKISKNTFISDCMKKVGKMPVKLRSGDLILSETYDEEKQREVYSIHEVSTIYGQVKFAV